MAVITGSATGGGNLMALTGESFGPYPGEYL